ncbi:MAG: HNH endonuclease signature motif containing protein [Romboutsia sp.]
MKKQAKLSKIIFSIAMAFMIISLNISSIFASDNFENITECSLNELTIEDLNQEDEHVLEVKLDDEETRNILGVEYVLVKISMSYDSTNKKHVWNFNVDIPTSVISKPPLKLKVQILRADTENGTYSNYGSLTDFGNVNTVKNYKHSVAAKTGYYKVKLTSQLKPDGSNSYNPAKTLSKPRADYVKNAIHNRPSNLNTKYYNDYKSKYGVTLNSTLYDVHHIKPLAYGGDNSFSNLIHLPKETHRTVTSWFSGY